MWRAGLLLAVATAAAAEPAAVTVGERLFRDPRFARPAAGPAYSCRTCHLVDEFRDVPGRGQRAYADFAARDPVPSRADGVATTARNAPSLVGATLAPYAFLHADGEFATARDLVHATLTGRSLGWLPGEEAEAVAHVARVVREDTGDGPGAGGVPYRVVLRGTDPSLPRALRLPRRFRVDVARAGDADVVAGVARLVAAYLDSLRFAADSPYDRFLARNRLPRRPRRGEPVAAYVARLRRAVERLRAPVFVGADDGSFTLHAQPFVFGPLELDGLRVFLRETGPGPGVGNCAGCHPPPHFTDFGFHNTGVTQLEYDAVHGPGAFAALAVPDAAARAADPAAFLPPTPTLPAGRGPFRAAPTPDDPTRADLGVWNVVLHPGVPGGRHQRRLARAVCRAHGDPAACARGGPDALLDAAIALFKTPGLRDLGHSDPYLHTGGAATLEEVLVAYRDAAALAAAGALRNPAPELGAMRLGGGDVPRLAAFLRALNEDYD